MFQWRNYSVLLESYFDRIWLLEKISYPDQIAVFDLVLTSLFCVVSVCKFLALTFTRVQTFDDAESERGLVVLHNRATCCSTKLILNILTVEVLRSSAICTASSTTFGRKSQMEKACFLRTQ